MGKNAWLDRTGNPSAGSSFEGLLPGQQPDPQDVKCHQLSKREVSFEQQRALPKLSIVPPQLPVGQPERPDNDRKISESGSGAQQGSLYRIKAAECWRFVKPTVIRVSRASTREWPCRRSKSRKATPTRRQESTSRRPSGFISLPTGVRAGNKDQVRNHGSVAGDRIACSAVHERPMQSLQRRNYHQKEGRAQKYTTFSPIPYLHDPLEDSRFSEECRKFLKSLDADSDWSLPIASTSNVIVREKTLTYNIPSQLLDLKEGSIREQVLPDDRFPLPPSQREAESNSKDIISGPAPSSVTSQRPEILIRLPSKNPGSLTSMLHMPRTGPTSLSSTQIVHATSNAQKQNREDVISSLKPTQTRSVTRLSSARSVMSADTLAGIEAQVQSNFHSGIGSGIERVFMENSVSSAVNRDSGPPPDKPLPALPSEALDQQSDVMRSSTNLESLDLRRGESSATSLEFPRYAIRGPRAERVRARRMRDLAKSRNQSPNPDAHVTKVEACKEPDLGGDLKSSIVVDDFVDELDRFPAVPDSRPTSMGSMSAWSTYSRHSPDKPTRQRCQMSKSTSDDHSSRPSGQKLSQSNIFVVVDSDPATGRFRAGAISPTLSIAGSKPERQSPKRARTTSKLREVITHHQSPTESPKRDTALRSPKGAQVLTPGRSANNHNKRPATSDSRNQSSSSDEQSVHSQSAASPKKVQSRPKKRRRWNSGDLSLIKLLQRNLEEYYATIQMQEDRIRWQAQQIQMMTRVFAPMSRLRGVKVPPLLQGSPELPPMKGESQFSRRLVRSSWSGSKNWREWNPEAPSPLSIIEEQALNARAQSISHSENDTSRSPVVARALPGLTGVTAGDAWKIDPVVHDNLVQNNSNAAESRYYRL